MSGLYVESAGDGPDLVLLHGFAMHGGLFAPIVPELAHRYRVHVVDLPGHGHTPPASPLTLPVLVTAVADYIASLRCAVTVLGWSLGGMVALRLAREFPARVDGLVLACTTPRFVAGDDWPHAMSATALARFGDEMKASYRLTLQRFLTLQVHGSERGRATLATLRHELFARPAPSPAALSAVLAILAEIDLRDEVSAIAKPALVIAGQRDALTPPAAGAWLARAMANARYVEIAGAAHAPFLSHREAFAAAVRSFLDARELSRA
jgi:pimeloyl-[acyl-carrier protein] methyl ester esterase